MIVLVDLDRARVLGFVEQRPLHLFFEIDPSETFVESCFFPSELLPERLIPAFV
jgi:hypothetical protein